MYIIYIFVRCFLQAKGTCVKAGRAIGAKGMAGCSMGAVKDALHCDNG